MPSKPSIFDCALLFAGWPVVAPVVPVVEADPLVVLVGWPAGGLTPVPIVPAAGFGAVGDVGAAAGRVVVAAGGRAGWLHRAAAASENSINIARSFTFIYRFFGRKALHISGCLRAAD